MEVRHTPFPGGQGLTLSAPCLEAERDEGQGQSCVPTPVMIVWGSGAQPPAYLRSLWDMG